MRKREGGTMMYGTVHIDMAHIQPKKRGVKRCANRFVSTLYAIASVFYMH
jgi:hypothetical protein